MHDEEILSRLRPMIGRHFLHNGQRCTLVELLIEQAAAVLESREPTSPVQTDQYGQPSRRSRETWTIPVFDETGAALSDELLELFRHPDQKD
jgi:hypothetical protein